jgi:CheY-like chemotaxis protein
MPGGGSLTIKQFAAPYAVVQNKFPQCAPGCYVGVSVADTGIGFDDALKSKIFDPFFSTKERGKGTGLGLSIVHGIVKSHQGYIHVESQRSVGTTFTLFFPVIATGEQPAVSAGPPVERRNHETILVVDDEELIREMLKEYLEDKGYAVLTAKDGHEALAVYEKMQAEIDLVITDLGMPEMGGEELFSCLRVINPAAKVMVSSGYIDKVTKDKLIGMGIMDVLTKPYRLELIQSAIDALME